MRNMIDVVYPLGDGSRWGNNELRFSLRSLQRHLRDLGRVFVVGRRPAWLVEAVHIPMEDVHRHNKDANLIDKVLAACWAGVSERFLRLSDDQCLLRPVAARDLKAYHLGPLDEKRGGFWGFGKWKRRLRRTYGLLLHEGLPTLHYDSHIPMLYQRERFVQVMSRWPYREGLGYCINTLYFNQVPMKMRHGLQGRQQPEDAGGHGRRCESGKPADEPRQKEHRHQRRRARRTQVRYDRYARHASVDSVIPFHVRSLRFITSLR